MTWLDEIIKDNDTQIAKIIDLFYLLRYCKKFAGHLKDTKVTPFNIGRNKLIFYMFNSMEKNFNLAFFGLSAKYLRIFFQGTKWIILPE